MGKWAIGIRLIVNRYQVSRVIGIEQVVNMYRDKYVSRCIVCMYWESELIDLSQRLCVK